MKKYAFFAATALMLAACNSEEVPTVPDGEVVLKVNAAISGTVTRASGTTWSPNDQIGISTVGTTTQTFYANIPYTWNGSNFDSDGADIYFQDATETVTFSAYYPFTGTAGTAAGIINNITTDASNQTAANQPKIDFLFATGATASKESPTVNFMDDHAFNHCMTQITIEFKEGNDVDFDDNQLTGYTLSGMVMSGSFDTATGTATAAGEDAEDLTIALSNVSTTSGVYSTSVIVFPQENVKSIPLSVTVEGQTYSATLTVPTTDSGTKTGLQPGHNYRFPVTVSKTDMTVGTAEINDWTAVTDDENTATM